ncbi:BTH_I0359 family protein [Cupriavidus gilardii]|uniref:BTH_I0359 family protein n=1 Tax=Cupriavidus gilardii TaxID=82541 RepID=UPI001573A9D5|nr:DUF3567 domain-containing protein [Cupriavidus gilardii]NSX06766.1 DUF3567 domain-containing protein [Cupriavidus gilardii]
MQMIYNSDNYCIVEFGADVEHAPLASGGYEIVDKNMKREIFLGGQMAEHFRADVQRLIESEPSVEEVDEFLGKFDTVMTHSLVMH